MLCRRIIHNILSTYVDRMFTSCSGEDYRAMKNRLIIDHANNVGRTRRCICSAFELNNVIFDISTTDKRNNLYLLTFSVLNTILS